MKTALNPRIMSWAFAMAACLFLWGFILLGIGIFVAVVCFAPSLIIEEDEVVVSRFGNYYNYVPLVFLPFVKVESLKREFYFQEGEETFLVAFTATCLETEQEEADFVAFALALGFKAKGTVQHALERVQADNPHLKITFKAVKTLAPFL